MFLNGYSVRIPEGEERAHGYVHLRHGQTYSLVLGNKSECRCNVNVAIDGKDVGTWRMERGQTMKLERPVNEAKLFTFYKAASAEGASVGADVGKQEQGLLTVTFVPEDTTRPAQVFKGNVHRSFEDSGSGYRGGETLLATPQSYAGARGFNNLSAGVTGLSGYSNQSFGVAEHMRLDHASTQVVNLRLVCVDASVVDPTPLRPVTSQSTPVPSPLV